MKSNCCQNYVMKISQLLDKLTRGSLLELLVFLSSVWNIVRVEIFDRLAISIFMSLPIVASEIASTFYLMHTMSAFISDAI